MLHVKIFSSVYVCAVSDGSTFSSRKSGLSLGKTVAPEWFGQAQCGVFGISSLWEQQIDSHERQVPTANQSYGAMECTVNGHYSNMTVAYKEKILHVIILDICRSVPTGVFFYFFVFLPVQIDTHAGLKGQEVTCSLLPLDYWPHGLVLSRCDRSFSRRWRW